MKILNKILFIIFFIIYKKLFFQMHFHNNILKPNKVVDKKICLFIYLKKIFFKNITLVGLYVHGVSYRTEFNDLYDYLFLKTKYVPLLFIGEKITNNHAEYAGLILGLEQAIVMGIKKLRVEGDSLLVINHMKEIYKCKSINLLELYDKAKELERNFETVEYLHIYRKDNKRADYLSNIAINNDLYEESIYIYDDNDSDYDSEIENY
jgi:ribonuclease HI